MGARKLTLAALLLTAASPSPFPSAASLINVKKDGKWGVLDQHGKTVVALAYDSLLINDYGLISATRDKQTTYFDATGRTVFTGFSYVSSPDRNGFFEVYSPSRLVGLISRDGSQILPPIFGYVTAFDDARHYVVHYKGRVAVIDLSGKPMFEKTFFFVSSLSKDGLAIAKPDRDTYGVIDATGSWIIPPGKFEEIHDFSEDGLASAKFGGKWGFIDRSGAWVVPPISEGLLWIDAFNKQGTAPVKVGGKWGFIDRKGAMVVTPRYDDVSFSQDGVYRVQIGGLTALVDGHGKTVFKPMFSGVTEFHSEGLAAAWVGEKSFIINRRGESVFGNRFERVGGFFGGGWAAAQKGGKWGAIDTKGQWILKPTYDCVSICFDDPPPVITIAPLPS